MRSPSPPPGLRATVLTCVPDPATAAFDPTALEAFTAGHAVLEIREHAFQLAGRPLLAFVIVHAGPRAAAPVATAAAPPAAAEPAPRPPTASATFSAPPRPSRNGDQLHVPATDRPLYDRLCAWRNAEARALGKPSYVLFRNVELAAVAALRPASLANLQEIHGIGRGKAEQFGRALLAIVHESATHAAAHAGGEAAAEDADGPSPADAGASR